jgi:photosystem II stability/assembly factor-like uncharacterized protein
MSRQYRFAGVCAATLLAAIFLFRPFPALATDPIWQHLGALTSPVEVLAVNPTTITTLYAGANPGGMYKSTDRGEHWQSANNGLPSPFVSPVPEITGILVDPATPSTVYTAITWVHGYIYKSTDSGSTWVRTTTDLLGDTRLTAFVLNPQTTTTLYLGTWGGGVYKTTNGGVSWAEANGGLNQSSLWVNALAIDPKTPGTLYMAADFVFKSTNAAGSWVSASFGLPAGVSVVGLAVDPQTPATVYAATAQHGVYRTTTGGTSWAAVNSGLADLHVRSIAVSASAPSHLSVATASGVYRSLDGGASWTALNDGLPSQQVSAVIADVKWPSSLYAVTTNGVYAYRPEYPLYLPVMRK